MGWVGKMAERPERGFRFLEHTTDAEVEVFGEQLSESFEYAGLATEEIMVDLSSIHPEKERTIEASGRDLESLLYSWLESLISLQDIDGMLFSKLSCKVSKVTNGFTLSATAFGEKFDPKKHEQKTAIKAPTYHNMKIIQDKRGVSMRFLLDL
jgi:SHS2 domain-containing protein